MSQANGFSPKRAHKYKVNASILASCTKLQADFYLLNLSLQTKFPTLKKNKTNLKRKTSGKKQKQKTTPLLVSFNSEFSASDNWCSKKGLVINSLCVDQSGISCFCGPDVHMMEGPQIGATFFFSLFFLETGSTSHQMTWQSKLEFVVTQLCFKRQCLSPK